MNNSGHSSAKSRLKNTTKQKSNLPLSSNTDNMAAAAAGGTTNELSEEEDIESYWDDPELVNNPEKLMKLKFDDDLIQAATTPGFMKMVHFHTEMILQDENIMKLFKDYRKLSKQKTGELKEKSVSCTSLNKTSCDKDDDQPLVSRIDSILAKIDREQEEGVRIYLETKNKPFWDPQAKKDVLSEDQKKKVEDWVETLNKFSTTFESAISLRFRRSSIAPKSTSDPEAEKLVEQLRRINEELTKASKVFDMILK